MILHDNLELQLRVRVKVVMVLELNNPEQQKPRQLSSKIQVNTNQS